MDEGAPDPVTLYEAVGGSDWFVGLVDLFYEGVAADADLSGMYPRDLTDSKAHLASFLIQYWGGPTTYSEERGHPRLRMRHAPFEVGRRERDAWMEHMSDAVRALAPSEEIESALLDYFEMAATHMINRPG